MTSGFSDALDRGIGAVARGLGYDPSIGEVKQRFGEISTDVSDQAGTQAAIVKVTGEAGAQVDNMDGAMGTALDSAHNALRILTAQVNNMSGLARDTKRSTAEIHGAVRGSDDRSMLDTEGTMQGRTRETATHARIVMDQIKVLNAVIKALEAGARESRKLTGGQAKLASEGQRGAGAHAAVAKELRETPRAY